MSVLYRGGQYKGLDIRYCGEIYATYSCVKSQLENSLGSFLNFYITISSLLRFEFTSFAPWPPPVYLILFLSLLCLNLIISEMLMAASKSSSSSTSTASLTNATHNHAILLLRRDLRLLLPDTDVRMLLLND